MKISIITIVFNSDKHLEKTIQSVISQNYPNYEYIIIDGGSTDNSINIIKNYQKFLKYWVSEKDKGISDAFNKGIKIATGDYILFLNSDDYFYSNYVLRNIFLHVFNSNQVICGKCILSYEKNEYLKGHTRKTYSKLPTSHQSIFYPKRIFDVYGLFDEKYDFAMDYEHYLRFMKNTSFKFINEIVSVMRMEGVSCNNPVKTCIEMIKADVKYYNPGVILNSLRLLLHFKKITWKLKL